MARRSQSSSNKAQQPGQSDADVTATGPETAFLVEIMSGEAKIVDLAPRSSIKDFNVI